MYSLTICLHSLFQFFCMSFCTTQVVKSVRESYWKQRDGNSDITSSVRQLWSQPGVQRASKCAALCGQDARCVSFFYNNVVRYCQGHSITLGNHTSASKLTSTKYFVETSGKWKLKKNKFYKPYLLIEYFVTLQIRV